MRWRLHRIPTFRRLRQKDFEGDWIPVTAGLKERRGKGSWKDGSVVATLVLDLIPPPGFCRHQYIHYARVYPLKIKTQKWGSVKCVESQTESVESLMTLNDLEPNFVTFTGKIHNNLPRNRVY